jgi:hypothetical protein
VLRDSKSPAPGFKAHPLTAIVSGLLIAGLLILIFQHWMHPWIWLPYALILGCPLMMLYMMRGHE